MGAVMPSPTEQLRGASLTERQMRCLAMWYFDGLKQAEIAERLSMSQPAVCQHIAAGRRRLTRAGLTPRRPEAQEPPIIITMPPEMLDSLAPADLKALW